MFKNIFSRRIDETIDFLSPTTESFDDIELAEFMLMEQAMMSRAVIENARYTYMGEREDCAEIVQESTGDFLTKVIDFFKNLLAKIKEWFGKIFLLIQTLIGNTGKMLEENKDTFLRKKAKFDLQGFDYTISDNAPKMDPINNIVSEYNREISKIKEITPNMINERRDDFKGKLHKLRGEILTNNESIDDGELRETCDAFFRNGETESSIITIDNKYMLKIASEYSKVKKSYADAVKQKRNLEVQLESLKKFFENGARQVRYDSQGERSITTSEIEMKNSHVKRTGEEKNVSATTSTLKLFNMYFNFRYEQSRDLSNITLTVLESKVRALKDQLKFYDVCVRKWITVPNNSVNGQIDDNDNKSDDKGGDDK